MFSKIKKNYFLLISTFLLLYFFFNLLDGERGLFSYLKKKEVLKELQQTERDYISKINENLDITHSLVGLVGHYNTENALLSSPVAVKSIIIM